jgi:hypothetical protein
MTDTMIERVARAIALAEFNQSDSGVCPKWSDYRDHARAVLAAMREPTPGMIRQGEAEYDKIFPRDAVLADVMSPAMVDAALAETEACPPPKP